MLARQTCGVGSQQLQLRTQLRARPHQPRPRRTHIVKTSEFWWEDELEYDAVTEILAPKRVHVVAGCSSEAAIADVRSRIADVRMQTGFTGAQTDSQAQQIWEGRCVAPLFYKLRTRGILDELAAEEEASSSQKAEEFWKEVAGQNWRVELDYGLAGADQEGQEGLLVVATRLAAERLLQAADESFSLPSSGGYSDAVHAVVHLRGWGVGEDAGKPLDSWRQLKPSVELLGVHTA